MPRKRLKREKKIKNSIKFNHLGRKNPARAINSTCARMNVPTRTDFLFKRGSCSTSDAVRGGVINLESPPQKRRRPTTVLLPPSSLIYVGTKIGVMMSCQPVVPNRPYSRFTVKFHRKFRRTCSWNALSPSEISGFDFFNFGNALSFGKLL